MLHTFPDIRKFCDTQNPPDIQYFSAKLTPGYTVFSAKVQFRKKKNIYQLSDGRLEII